MGHRSGRRRDEARMGVTLAAAGILAVASSAPARAGNSWALPLIGGALGGYALNSFVQSRKAEPAAPVYRAAPRPAAHASQQQPATPEARLQQLDQLAAKGLITPAEYQQRRQAIINSL